jgi:hypothetical protein
MLVLDNNLKPIDEVILLLTQNEASELSSKLKYLLRSEIGSDHHVHVSDSNCKKEITISTYVPGKIKNEMLSEQIKKLILTEV